MSETNFIYAFGYFFMWVLTFITYHFFNKKIDSGSAIIATYVLYAIFSIMVIQDPIFGALYKPLEIFPYLYLYVMILISISPIIYHHLHPTQEITDSQTRLWVIMGWIIVVCSLCLIPTLFNNFETGIIKLFTDNDAGKDAYKEQIENAENAGSKITNIPSIIFNALSDFCIFIYFYFLSLKKKKTYLIYGLSIAIIVSILIPITNGQRGGVIMEVFTIIGAYMLFRQYLSKKINKIVTRIGIVFMLLVSLPIAAITISRFSNMGPGVGGFLNWYVGQGSLYFNNYGLDDGGIRYGDRTLNLFKRIVDSNTSVNYSERRAIYHNLEINDDVFSTFVGDFTIDFGPVLAFFIFVFFNMYILFHIRNKDESISLDKLVLIYFAVCVNMQGGMALFSFSDTANLRLMVFIFVYAYLRYHSVLIQKFPLKR